MSEAAHAIPYSLMPVAVVLLSTSLLSFGRALYLKRSSAATSATTATTNKRSSSHRSSPQQPSSLFCWISGFIALFCYAIAIGRIQGAILKREHAQFDPYAILNLPADSNTTVITSVYRDYIKTVHPSNKETGNQQLFETAVWAYRALTEETAEAQWKRHGHPSGPLLTPVFLLELPSWLLYNWPEQVKKQMMGAYGLVLAVVVWAWMQGKASSLKQRLDEKDNDDDDDDEEEDVLSEEEMLSMDLTYFAKHLSPTMSRMDVLLLAMSAPSNIRWVTHDLKRIAKLRKKRIESLAVEASKKKQEDDILNALCSNDDGWADDDDDEDGEGGENQEQSLAAKARQAELEKQKELESLQRATGKAVMMLEGIDEGVLGHQWVMKTLAAANKWPPKDLGILQNETFAYQNNQQLAALDHPAVARVLCMVTGRVNSSFLNGHQELNEAGAKQKIDQTYFAASMYFRQRMGGTMETMIHLGAALKSGRLLTTMIEAVAMFKVGCQYEEDDWFKRVTYSVYKCIPEVNVSEQLQVATEGHDEVVCSDITQLQFVFVRTHAANFLKQKIEACKKQGIPPQVGLAQYQEGWWILVQYERLDGLTPPITIRHEDPVFSKAQMSQKQLAVFDNEDPTTQLIQAYPLNVRNVSQANIRAKLEFKAPSEPGRYRFTVVLKSHDFIGCDNSCSVETTIVSSLEAGREPTQMVVQKQDEVEREENKETEGKKEK